MIKSCLELRLIWLQNPVFSPLRCLPNLSAALALCHRELHYVFSYTITSDTEKNLTVWRLELEKRTDKGQDSVKMV